MTASRQAAAVMIGGNINDGSRPTTLGPPTLFVSLLQLKPIKASSISFIVGSYILFLLYQRPSKFWVIVVVALLIRVNVTLLGYPEEVVAI
jgi:hypothetical protein